MNPKPPIFTLTGNLLAERTLEFESWTMGRTQRADRATFQVGGKGINVAKMLLRFGAPTTALCFAGGATGQECESWLRERKFPYHAFSTTAATRSGTVVRSRAQAETTFFTPDAPPDAAAIRACADFLNRQPLGAVLAVCGSLPGWSSSDFDPLRDALYRWLERGPLVVDTYGPALKWLADLPLTFVRINRSELATLHEAPDEKASGGELLRAIRDRFRVLRWAISDGPAPVWFADEASDPETILPPRVVQVSATGSGDVMLASVLYARYHQEMSWREAVAWALPLAAANAAHSGVAEFPLPRT